MEGLGGTARKAAPAACRLPACAVLHRDRDDVGAGSGGWNRPGSQAFAPPYVICIPALPCPARHRLKP